MIEDKLDQDQRIRLECLAQANIAAGLMPDKTATSVINVAKKFEKFIKEGTA